MGWFGDDHDVTQGNNDYQTTGHKAKVTHEALGSAAAYEAAKAYEKHCAANGKPVSHAKAKEIAAGLAGAFIDREVETKGLDYIDKERAKKHAQGQFDQAVIGLYVSFKLLKGFKATLRERDWIAARKSGTPRKTPHVLC
ncbi:Protein of unknown function (DUF3759) domain containing protein [Lactarius tabidus]